MLTKWFEWFECYKHKRFIQHATLIFRRDEFNGNVYVYGCACASDVENKIQIASNMPLSRDE